jgi:poly(A) polymerase
MSEVPPKKSSREDAVEIVKRLRAAGHIAYLAGGCVRDLLLGLEPKDYDVATDAPPERVRKLFNNTQAVGAAFGVILVRLGGSQIEVATFRADMNYEDGRHPVGVRFTSAEEDARRRDFTINGLFLDPLDDRVIDYVGGQDDLSARILRAIGEPNHRFEEDHLRLLRALRFASRFNLAIDPTTADAITSHAPSLTRISPERVGEELRLMLTPTTRIVARNLLWEFKLIQVIFRTLPERPDEPKIPIFDKLAVAQPISSGLALAALSLEYRSETDPIKMLDRPEIQRTNQACRTTLKISNEESDRLAGVLHLADLLGDAPPRIATMKRFLASPFSGDARLLLDTLARTNVHVERIRWLTEQITELQKRDVAPPPLITGDDLTAAGLKPGKLFKRILNDTYDAQLEDRITSKQHAMNMAMEIARSFPSPGTPGEG